MEKNKIEDISRYITIALLLAIIAILLHVSNKLVAKEEIKNAASTTIREEFLLQELKGNVFYNP